MDLNHYRREIDKIDSELVRLFQARMDIAAHIADYKKEKGLPILQPAREQEKLLALSALCREELQPYLTELYTLLFRLSRDYQAQSTEGL
jgi:chorismate mutase/prephenate dehydratase